jgi:bacillopeptidase F
LIPSYAQISSELQERLNQDLDEYHRIRIEFTENVDCYALNHQFKQERLRVDERAKTITRQLQDRAELSQKEVVELLERRFSDASKNVKSFWIVNIIVLEAKVKVIEALAQMPQVALIDIEESTIIPHDEIIRSEIQSQRSPNGIEPGLEAINAPAMWALGYTGRGRIVYDYDTGVWPTHPAFADRFLAHRYPMDQCWFGYFSHVPNGNISDHGTHTLGTMAGLVEADNDTIGVAFKSYWIANDFVTSTVAALPPLTNMIEAFEWALNPDGDINTTSDIPDVINNSWRWRDDPDTVQCAGFVVNLMNAIEAAGIANIFSGGNSGPSNTSVNAPQRINTSEVNTFSVGSINANQAFPHPISNFSTRGPSQCDYTGSLSLEIHPEVVAPGQNVRSAWGFDEFNTISGTSMAAPHVSGAILLLKEAFPYLSGEDLMWALYLTAIDMGDPGEDNTFGMGLIDVHSAYLYLGQSNTPVDPNTVPWDIAITASTNPAANGITCENSFGTTVSFSNLGDNAITSVNFTYDLNGSVTASELWTGTLEPGQSTTFTLPIITTTDFGKIGFSIKASITGQPNEYDLYNNNWYMTFNRRPTVQLPFVEDFNYGFNLKDWIVQNDDGATGWETMETNGLEWTGKSATVQCATYSPRSDQKDGLISTSLALPSTADPIWLIFDVAYQKWTSSVFAQDTLSIQASSNCGTTFPDLLYYRAGDELNTRDTVQLNFTPEFEWDWRQDSVNLSQYAGEEILIRFETTNRKGNNIYIDNVKIFSGNIEPNSIPDLEKEVVLYPNPTSSEVYIEFLGNLGETEYTQVLNVLGEAIHVPINKSRNRFKIDTRNLESGLYFVDILTEAGKVTKRFVKQ